MRRDDEHVVELGTQILDRMNTSTSGHALHGSTSRRFNSVSNALNIFAVA